jgi:anti-sigma factor RsiW
MKKEKTEELIVKWIDGQLDSNEERQLSALFQEDPDLEKELQEMKALSESVSAEIPASVEPPYGDFFNSQLMRKVDLEIESRTPARKVERWWESFRWAWAPAGALALVLSFFAGHRVARPADAPIAQGQAETIRIESLPTVYFTGESLDAEVIADSNGEVSAIVVNGLSAIRDDIDVATVTTSTVLPKSYSKSEARRFD